MEMKNVYFLSRKARCWPVRCLRGNFAISRRSLICERPELELDWKLCMEGKDVIWIDPIR